MSTATTFDRPAALCRAMLLGLVVAVASSAPVAAARSIVLPWIAQTRGAVVQSSELLLFNPGPAAMDVTLEFRKRGNPASSPPRATRLLTAGQTLRIADPLPTLFSQANELGFLVVRTAGDVAPVVSARVRAAVRGQVAEEHVVTGIDADTAASAGAAAPGPAQYLVGLHAGAGDQTSLWLFNEGSDTANADVIFRALDGHVLGVLTEGLPPGKLRQLNRAQFPASLNGAYLLEVRVKAGKALAAAQVINNATNDPAYVHGEPR